MTANRTIGPDQVDALRRIEGTLFFGPEPYGIDLPHRAGATGVYRRLREPRPEIFLSEWFGWSLSDSREALAEWFGSPEWDALTPFDQARSMSARLYSHPSDIIPDRGEQVIEILAGPINYDKWNFFMYWCEPNGRIRGQAFLANPFEHKKRAIESGLTVRDVDRTTINLKRSQTK